MATNSIEEIGKPTEGWDANFEMNIKKYAHYVQFQTTIKALQPEAVVKGQLTFMVCDANRCLPPTDWAFEVKLSTTR